MPVEWIDLLRSALDAEFGDARPHVAALASVDADGESAVRMVVCRKIDERGALHFVSDARSEKNGQLRRKPAAAVVFWLADRREQFRLRGAVEILDGSGGSAQREAMWRSLSGPSRALFAWPAPSGERVADDSAFVRELSADLPVPPTFEVIVLTPDQVDHLDLNRHPHERTHWEGPQKRRLNP